MTARLALLATLLAAPALAADPAPRLAVSDNHRFLVTAENKPFFWLGDTAWELFHRATREEAVRYLDARAKQGFTVVQAVAIAEFDGDTVPNAYGHLPFADRDPAKLLTKDGPANDYWDHVDFVVKAANERGLVVGFLPTWGRYWHERKQDGPALFDSAKADAYGEWLGKRYADAAVVWVLGGDRGVATEGQKGIIRAMAAGLKRGDGGKHLCTFHPSGGSGSAKDFHADKWLDFNMRQNGHVVEFTGRYDQTRVDYDRTPVKPVIDGEPIYEGHPVAFDAKKFGHSTAADVRRPLYWDLFGGACGHTYGHHSVWAFWKPGVAEVNAPLMSWNAALDEPGGRQMVHGRRLIESRPVLTRIPADDVIVTDRVATSVPGAGSRRFVATRDTDGTYAMVYAPIGRAFSVNMGVVKGPKVTASWFNPRTGVATKLGEFANAGSREFTSPDPGELLDWVLVLDDAAKGYSPPGTAPASQKR